MPKLKPRGVNIKTRRVGLVFVSIHVRPIGTPHLRGPDSSIPRCLILAERKFTSFVEVPVQQLVWYFEKSLLTQELKSAALRYLAIKYALHNEQYN